MPAINQVPEVLNDFRVYEEGSDNCLGVAKVELPSESVMTQTVKGVGIAGEVEAPVIGHYSSMETKLTWNTPTDTTHRLTGGRGVRLEVRGAIQCWDSANDKYTIIPTRIVIRGRAKSKENGSYEAGNTIEATNTIETTYLKIEQNDKVVREIDKYAYKDSIADGTDLMSGVRSALGLN